MAESNVAGTSESCIGPNEQQLQKIWSTLNYIFTSGGQEEKKLESTDDGILLSDIFEACIPQTMKTKKKEKKKANLNLTIATFEEAILLEEEKTDHKKQPYSLTGNGDQLRVKYTPRPPPPQPQEPSPQNLETPPGNTSTELELTGEMEEHTGVTSLPGEKAEEGWSQSRSESKKSKKKKKCKTTEEEENNLKRPNEDHFDEENDPAKSSSIPGATGPDEVHQTESSPLLKTDQPPKKLQKIWSTLNFIFKKGGKEGKSLPCTNDEILLSDIIEEYATEKNKAILTIATFIEAFLWEKEKPDHEKQPYTLTGNGDKLRVKHTPRPPPPQPQELSPQNQETPSGNMSTAEEHLSDNRPKSNKSKKKHENTEEEENISKRPKGRHFNAEHDTAKSSWIQGATGPPDVEHQIDSSRLPKTDQQPKKQESSGHGARGQEPQREHSQGRRDGKEGGPRSTSHSPGRSRERQAGQASSGYGASGQGPQGEHSQGRRDGREDDRRRTGHSPRRDRDGRESREYRDPGRNEQTRWTQDSNRRQGGQYEAAQGSQPHYDERGQSSYQNRRGDNSDMRLSKSLSNVLRHRAKDLGFNILPGGFIYIDELLKHKFFKLNTQEDVLRVVENNDKKRFHVDFSEKRLKIRANQGHTMEVDVELREIEDPTEFPEVTHGTYFEVWEQIKKQGLSTMGRNHIHFAPGEPGESGVISGMRGSCELIIYIDMAGAMADGIKFFVSANNVILTKGNKDGVLNKKYFQIAVQRRPRMKLSLE